MDESASINNQVMVGNYHTQQPIFGDDDDELDAHMIDNEVATVLYGPIVYYSST